VSRSPPAWALVLALGMLAALPSAAEEPAAPRPPPAEEAGIEGAREEAAGEPADQAAGPEAGRETTAAAPAIDRRISLSSLRAPGTDLGQDLVGRGIGVFGCLAMVGVAWSVSTSRRRVNWRLVGMGLGLQLTFALLVLKTAAGRLVFEGANTAINKLLSFSEAGTRFLFGRLVDNAVPVGKPLFSPPEMSPVLTSELWASTGSMIAFRVLPTIIFFSALTAVLYHLGILTRLVRGLAFVMQRTMGTSGAESLSASANIFVGQTEAPLLVRPFIDKMTQSELMCVMTGGFATVAGGVMAAYVGMLSSTFSDIAGHLLAASVMSAPAALVMAKIMVPETEEPATRTSAGVSDVRPDANVVDAAARGTSEGLMLALNVGAMLLSFLALIAVVNFGIGAVASQLGYDGLSLERIFGWLGAPIAFLLGTPWDDAANVGALIGTKTVVNEFVAYSRLAGMLSSGELHHAKSAVIATYALCGFSNFGSIGIQLGGLSALAPGRRSELARLGLRAMLAGSLACFQTAAIAAIVL
jgi:concentrative nucleoside transporter, CNT family